VPKNLLAQIARIVAVRIRVISQQQRDSCRIFNLRFLLHICLIDKISGFCRPFGLHPPVSVYGIPHSVSQTTGKHNLVQQFIKHLARFLYISQKFHGFVQVSFLRCSPQFLDGSTSCLSTFIIRA